MKVEKISNKKIVMSLFQDGLQLRASSDIFTQKQEILEVLVEVIWKSQVNVTNYCTKLFFYKLINLEKAHEIFSGRGVAWCVLKHLRAHAKQRGYHKASKALKTKQKLLIWDYKKDAKDRLENMAN